MQMVEISHGRQVWKTYFYVRNLKMSDELGTMIYLRGGMYELHYLRVILYDSGNS